MTIDTTKPLPLQASLRAVLQKYADKLAAAGSVSQNLPHVFSDLVDEFRVALGRSPNSRDRYVPFPVSYQSAPKPRITFVVLKPGWDLVAPSRNTHEAWEPVGSSVLRLGSQIALEETVAFDFAAALNLGRASGGEVATL